VVNKVGVLPTGQGLQRRHADDGDLVAEASSTGQGDPLPVLNAASVARMVPSRDAVVDKPVEPRTTGHGTRPRP
jgi:hypothetical protein